MRLIEQLVVLISIIPATQFFRSSITGLGGGLTDSLSSNALSMGAGVAMGAVSGFMSNKFSRGEKGGKQHSQNNEGTNIPLKNTQTMKSSSIASNMSGSIPNADFGRFTTSVGKVAKPIKEVVKPGMKIGKSVIGTGLAVGGVAIGNKGLTGVGTFMATSGMSELSDDISSKTGKFVDYAKDLSRDKNADENGFKYVQDLGDVDGYKYNTTMLRESTGIEDMSDCNFGNKKGVAVTLDGTMSDENGYFETSNKNLQAQSKNIGTMVRAFKNNDTEAINAYRKSGIENCSIKDGKVVVGLNSSNSLGIVGASKEGNGKNIIVSKTKLANKSMNFRIPKVTEGVTYENDKNREDKIFADVK